MADAALFLGWNHPLPGREAAAVQIFMESTAFYQKLQKEGRIESFEPVFISAHGGDLNGFVLLRGERQKLDQLREDEEFLKLLVRAGHCIGGIGLVNAFIGKSLERIMGIYAETTPK